MSGMIAMAANAGVRVSAESTLRHTAKTAFAFPGSRLFPKPFPARCAHTPAGSFLPQSFRQLSSNPSDGEGNKDKGKSKKILSTLTKLNALKMESLSSNEEDSKNKAGLDIGAYSKMTKGEQEVADFFTGMNSEDPLETLMQVPANEVRFKELLQEEESEYTHTGPKRFVAVSALPCIVSRYPHFILLIWWRMHAQVRDSSHRRCT
jgi:hypothetical protein